MPLKITVNARPSNTQSVKLDFPVPKHVKHISISFLTFYISECERDEYTFHIFCEWEPIRYEHVIVQY